MRWRRRRTARVGMQLLRPGPVGRGDLLPWSRRGRPRAPRRDHRAVRGASRLPIVPAPPARLPAVASSSGRLRAPGPRPRRRRAGPPHRDAAHDPRDLRADGAPRLTGLEVHFGEGELWLAMMPDSRKADDLRRDPRFSVHSAPDVEWSTATPRSAAWRTSSRTGTIDRFVATLGRTSRRAAWRCSAPTSPTPRWPGSRTTSWSSTSGAPARRRGRSAASRPEWSRR